MCSSDLVKRSSPPSQRPPRNPSTSPPAPRLTSSTRINRRAPQALYDRTHSLSFEAPLFRSPRRPRRSAHLRYDCRRIEHRFQAHFCQSEVRSLRAFRLRPKDKFPFDRQSRRKKRRKPFRHSLRKTGPKKRKPQLHGARYFVHILPARARRPYGLPRHGLGRHGVINFVFHNAGDCRATYVNF